LRNLSTLFCCALLIGCGDHAVHLDGAVQKGPFVLGSSISISTVDRTANPTGQVFLTQTTDDLGDFDISIAGQGFVAIEGNGFYYNEVTGKLSSAQLTLRALYDVGGAPTQNVYVNMITHLTYDRVKQLTAADPSLTLDSAEAQAETELRTGLGIGGAAFDPHASGVQMNIVGGDDDANAYLFAVSAIFAQIASDTANGASPDATLQELINVVSSSSAESGLIDAGFVQQIVATQENVDPQTIMDLLQQRLASIHSSASVPDLNRVWDSDGNGIPNTVDHACSIKYHDGGDGICVADGSCSPGYHDGGDGNCVAVDSCSTGYHDGGDGVCQTTGSCSTGYHDGGDGSCVPLGACSVGHDGGDGTCVPLGECSAGYLHCGSMCLASRFQTGMTYDVGSTPESIAAGDFNGDNKLDLVATDGQSNSAIVLLGNGDGTFMPGVNYSTGSVPEPLALADFNGDMKLDFAVADVVSYDIRFFPGNGDGTFATAISSPTPNNVQTVAMLTGKFNADSAVDIILVSPDYGEIIMLPGNGDGTFGSGTAFASGTSPYAMTSGDFNGDSKLDLAVSNQGSNDVAVLLGNGDGTFQPAVTYATGPYPTGIGTADFNGDHKLDLAVANYNNSAAGTVSILLGNGDGTFEPQVAYAVGMGPWPLVIGDFDADSKLDVLVEGFTSKSVSLLEGNGDGTFTAAYDYSIVGAGMVTAADFNGDSFLDFVGVYGNANNATVYLNNNCSP
jgi:hypothetical protein